MSYISNKNVGLEISKGNVTGHSEVMIFGRNPDVDTGSNEDLWNNGGTWVAPTTNRIHDIVSSSVNDTSAGSGARTVLVTGLNSSFAVTTETVTLNGTTNVPTSNSYVFIQSLKVVTAGATGSNEGTITATAQTDATVSASMGVGYNNTTLGIYQVPAGYTAYITSVAGGFQQASANNSCDIGLFIKPFGEVFQLKDIFPLTTTGLNADGSDYEQPIKVLEKGIIKCRTLNVSANNNDVHCTILLILVANA